MFLGLDLGTSALKVCLADAAGHPVATASEPLASRRADAASEQSADAWVAAAQTAVARLESDLRGVQAVGIAGHMHGAVVLGADARPLCPVMLWDDGRAEAEAAALDTPAFRALAGVKPSPGLTAPKLLWMARHAPELHVRIAHVVSPKDYLGLWLHGEIATDRSDAGGTFWFDQAEGAWSDALCAASRTDPAWLPPVFPGNVRLGGLRGEAARALGLSPGIPVAAGAGDTVAAALSLGACRPGAAFVNLGTSGQVFEVTAGYRPGPGLHAFAHTLPQMHYRMAAVLNGARPMAWLARLLGRPLEDLLREAATAPDGPLFLPYLAGERSPHDDPSIRAGFAGLGDEVTPGGLMRAVLEGIAASIAWAAEAMEPRDLLITGGGARADVLCQMLADALGRPLGRVPAAAMGPALGAAVLARAAAGQGDAFPRPEPERVFAPRPLDPGRVARWRRLYPALRGL